MIGRGFKRAEVSNATPKGAPAAPKTPLWESQLKDIVDGPGGQLPTRCLACGGLHAMGWCPLKIAGAKECELCGLAHFGYSRTCPHLNSVTQLRAMLDAIKQSTEPQELKDVAKKKITGIIGDLNQRKRKAQEKKDAAKAAQSSVVQAPNATAGNQYPGGNKFFPNATAGNQFSGGVAQAPNGAAGNQYPSGNKFFPNHVPGTPSVPGVNRTLTDPAGSTFSPYGIAGGFRLYYENKASQPHPQT